MSHQEEKKTELKQLLDLFKKGSAHQVLSQLAAIESSLNEHIEHIDYSQYELPM